MRRTPLVSSLLVFALSGCGGDGGATSTQTPQPETVASVTVTPATATQQVGRATPLQLTATVTGSRGGALTGKILTWTSSDLTAATVTSAGVVTALAPGQVQISASVDGRSGSSQVTLTVAAAQTVTVTPGTVTLPLGVATQLTATVTDQAGRAVPGAPITWTSLDTARASVGPTGVLSARRAGTATITATSGASSGQAVLTIGAAPTNASCKLPNRTGSVAFGFPRPSMRLRPSGTVRAGVVFVDFSDAPATRTPQNVFDIIDPVAPNFYRAVSYGNMTMVLQPTLRWLRMSKPSTQYGWTSLTAAAHGALLQEASDLAVAAGADLSQVDMLVVMTNPDAGAITNGPAFVPNAGGGIRVAGRATTIDNATNSGRDLLAWGGVWLNHESGHLMSLPDLYDYAPPAGTSLHLHVGEWSQMGQISGRGPEWTAFERWQLGWVSDDQMVCAPAGNTLVALTPIELAGGTKAAVVPLTATQAVVVESRRALGYDARLAQEGALVYLIETSVQSGRGTMRVLPVNDSDASKLTRTLGVGQSVTFAGATITLLSRTNGSDVVQVTRP